MEKPAFRREVNFQPAFDKRSPNPRQNYGIHGVDMNMVLVGPKGAIDLHIHTNWYLPHVAKEIAFRRPNPDEILMAFQPMAAQIGYHSSTPQYEGQEPRVYDCQFTGGDCYTDGSGLQAERFLDLLITKGSEAVWAEIEHYYFEMF